VTLRFTSYRASETVSSPVGATPHALGTLPSIPHRSRPRLYPATPVFYDPGPASIPIDRLTLTLPAPPSINHQYATVNGRRILSAAERDYKMLAARQVLVALARCSHRNDLLRTLRSDSLALSIHFYFTSRLRRDVDGGLKIAQDALCEALGINDNRVQEIHLFKHLDRTYPRIEVSLQPISVPGCTRSGQ